MPLAWWVGTWLLYFLIQVSYLIVFVFNLALGNPVVRDKDLIWITCLSGKIAFHYYKGESHGTWSMTLSGGTFTYYLTLVLRTTPLKPWERSLSSQEVHILQVRPGISQIPPLPVHPPSDLWTIPPSVSFCIPSPHCQNPLKRGEYCTPHRAEGITVLHQGPEVPLEEHPQNPSPFLPGICYPILHKEICSSPETLIGSNSAPGLDTSSSNSLTSTQQHACSLPALSTSCSNVPTGQLHFHKSLEQAGDGAAPATRRSIPGSSTKGSGHDICPVPTTLESNTPGDSMPMEGVWTNVIQHSPPPQNQWRGQTSLIRTNCHINLTKTNLANKDLVLNRIKMTKRIRILQNLISLQKCRRSHDMTNESSSRTLKERVRQMRWHLSMKLKCLMHQWKMKMTRSLGLQITLKKNKS